MPDTSLIGLTLASRFRITGVIGEGGMATVYRGLSGEGEGEEVAVKIMNPDLAKESRFVRRFRREAKAAAMLKHPNMVQILEFGVDQGYVFLAMELLRGQDLAMLLHRERRIPEARAVQIVIQVCRALSTAHKQAIIHRDLKPDNIMLVRAPEGQALPVPGMAVTDFVKVLDFGIAKILDADDDKGNPGDPRAEPITQEKSMLTRVGTIVGTPAYMAPEQGRAEPVDARTDVYACGVLLYELITGRVPFTGETPMQVVMRHVNEPPRPPSEHCPVQADVEKLIMRALAKFPAERQQTAEEMAFELLGVLPKVGGQAAAADEPDVKKTLVIEAPPPPPRDVAKPRPAAGAPAKPVPAPPPTRPTAAAAAQVATHAFQGDGASPFPTLNIEVPDDIFPAGFGPGAVSAPGSTDPAPTKRIDPPKAPAAPKPAAGVPLVQPGQERASLMQTLASEVESPPPSSDDEEEAATVIKAPTEVDRARMSLAEEAMAKALGQPAPAMASKPALGEGLPKFSGPDSVEPTLIAPGGSSGSGPAPAAPNPALAHEKTEITGVPAFESKIDLKNLNATLPLDPEEFEKLKAEANVSKAAAPAGPSPAPARESRRPTGELIPINLNEEAPKPPALAPPDAPLVWEPKPRRLSGATALVVGIAIGAVLVAVFLGVFLLMRGDGG